ncbi:MAG TPA: cytochrome c [Methylomirabilota bacterium]|jgi:cytochrome c556
MARALRAVVIVGVVSAVGLAGCASSKSSTASKDPVADRQRLMKLHGALWKDLQDKHKAGNIESMEVDAEALAVNAQRIPALFPEGSLTEKSKAKPEIWQKWPEFEAAAKNLETQSVKLRDSAKAKDSAAVDAQMKDFGRNACGTCHTPFRVPPPRQG